eukprot:2808288-Pyramimonas_sp.AAC.1
MLPPLLEPEPLEADEDANGGGGPRHAPRTPEPKDAQDDEGEEGGSKSSASGRLNGRFPGASGIGAVDWIVPWILGKLSSRLIGRFPGASGISVLRTIDDSDYDENDDDDAGAVDDDGDGRAIHNDDGRSG